MRLNLGSLALAMFSFLRGLRALEIKLALDLRSPSYKPECLYHLIDLPGSQWKTMCLEAMIMKPILETIERRCLQKWSQKKSSRRFEGTPEAALKSGLCRIKIKVITELEEGQMSQKFEDDCILNPKPEPCGLATESILWPSMCLEIELMLDFQRPVGIDMTSRSPWTLEEDQLLVELRKKKGLLKRQIAAAFPGRNQDALESRYHNELKGKNEPLGPQWTPEQDQLLKELKENKKLSWRQITEFFPGRTWRAVEKRYFTKLKGKDVFLGRQWTPEEDQLLTELREERKLSWKQIAEFFPRRTVAAVQKYYHTRPKETNKQPKETHDQTKETSGRLWGQWTPEEDQLLIKLREKGLTIRQIAEFFPGRSADTVEKRYYSRLKGKTTP